MSAVTTRTIEIVGVPMDLGGNRRGVDMGPSAIRYAGIEAKLRRMGFAVRDHGNLRVPDPGEERAHGPEAVRPEAFEPLRPLVERSDRIGISPIKHMPPVAAHPHQPNISQHPQMLRHGRLFETQSGHDVSHRALLERQVVQRFPPPRLGYRIERI